MQAGLAAAVGSESGSCTSLQHPWMGPVSCFHKKYPYLKAVEAGEDVRKIGRMELMLSDGDTLSIGMRCGNCCEQTKFSALLDSIVKTSRLVLIKETSCRARRSRARSKDGTANVTQEDVDPSVADRHMKELLDEVDLEQARAAAKARRGNKKATVAMASLESADLSGCGRTESTRSPISGPGSNSDEDEWAAPLRVQSKGACGALDCDCERSSVGHISMPDIPGAPSRNDTASGDMHKLVDENVCIRFEVPVNAQMENVHTVSDRTSSAKRSAEIDDHCRNISMWPPDSSEDIAAANPLGKLLSAMLVDVDTCEPFGYNCSNFVFAPSRSAWASHGFEACELLSSTEDALESVATFSCRSREVLGHDSQG